MPATTTERYVVASCHVERPLDDRVWEAFASLQRRRPGGIPISALMRPPDAQAGETDEARWLERARIAAQRAPLGHHTHWTGPAHARPLEGVDTAARVATEAAWLNERGIAPVLFCGGGWYGDLAVATECARRGYADCTPRSSRPPSLVQDGAWLELAAPARIALPDGAELVALPTTHTAGDVLRGARSLPARVHVYFHDTDLVDRRRRLVVEAALRIAGARRAARTLADELAEAAATSLVDWVTVVRGEGRQGR